MQDSTVVLAALGSALVVLGGYHFLVAAPELRRLKAALDTHGELLGGGAVKATTRIDELDRRVATIERGAPALDGRLVALEAAAQSEMPRVGFVRYNAFDDVGSDLSYALALLTRDGDGVVLSSIYSREDTRTYGKSVEKFVAAQDASVEEKAAIAKARAR